MTAIQKKSTTPLRYIVFYAIFHLFVFVLGCDSDSPSDVWQCTPDPSLIEDGRDCLATDQCPCGAHCYLGLCAAECLSDKDCEEDKRCDAFGYCRDKNDDTLTHLSTAKEGELFVEPVSIEVGDGNKLQHISISTDKLAIERVRIAVEGALEVRCGDTGEFSLECFLDNLEPGASAVVYVQAGPDLMVGGSGIVRVFAGEQQRLTVTYTWAASSLNKVKEGMYKGLAKLTEVGVGSDSPTERPSPVLEVGANVYAVDEDHARISLNDNLGWLLPTNSIVGEIVTTDSESSLVIEPFAWFSGQISEVDPIAAGVQKIETLVTLSGAAGNMLSFDLPMVFGGVLDSASPGMATWHVTLTRQSDLSDDLVTQGAPGASPPVTVPTVTPTTPLAWESAAVTALGDQWNSALVQTIVSRNNIATCKPTDHENLQKFALSEGFKGLVVETALTDAMPSPPTTLDVLFGDPATGVLPASYTTYAGDEVFNAIPCHLRFGYPVIDADPNCGETSLAPFIDDEDLCTEFATRFRCDIVDLEVPLGADGPTIDWQVQATAPVNTCTYTVDYQGEVEVRKVCRLPKVPHDCTEIAMCYDPGDGTASPVSSVLFETLPETLPALSGDLPCQAGTRSAEVEADSNLGSDDGTKRLGAQQMFEACVADLERLQSPIPDEGLEGLFASEGCIDVGRSLFAMGMVAELLYDSKDFVRERSGALLHRIAQQWFHTLAFLAHESKMRESLGPAVRMQSGADASNWVGASDIIDLLLNGLHPLLHPRIAGAIHALPDALLVTPDYRPEVIINEDLPNNPNHDQNTGLSVAILESLTALMALVELRLESARYTGDQTALTQAGQAFRYSLVLSAMARDLRDRASAQAGGTLSWSFRYDTAKSALNAALERTLAATRALLAGRNPLGIENTDLPLYFMEEQGDLSATQRFSAISDFLLGDGLGSTAWAPGFVAAANDSLEEARTAWLAQQDRELQSVLTTGDLDERIIEMKTQYGEQLVDLCGQVEGVSTTGMVDWEGFDAETCFRVQGDENSDCGLTGTELAGQEAEILDRLDQEDVAYLFCLAHELSARTGSSAGFTDKKVKAFAKDCYAQNGQPTKTECPADVLENSPESVCVGCTVMTDFLVFETVSSLQIKVDEVFKEIQAEAQAACGLVPEFPSVDVEREIPNRSECYRGSIGELALNLQAIAKDVEIARSELADHQDAYDIVMKSCFIKQLGGAQLELAQQNHNNTMSSLRTQKRDADIAAAWAAGTKDCTATLSGASGGALLSGGASMGLAAASCAAAMAEAAANTASLVFEAKMDEAEANHELTMMSIQNDIDNKVCFNDAEMELVGVRTKSLAVQRAMIDLELGLLQFKEAKNHAAQLYHESQASLAGLKDRTVWPKQYDYWIHEKVDTFKRNMRLAKQLTYLAVLAVEYEYQQSLTGQSGGLKQQTLAAELPSALEAVLTELWQTAGTRTIRGNRPTDLKVVMSLRDQLLQLADHSDFSKNELPLNEQQRFRLLLQSPAYRVFDDSGEYLGQRIPFNIAPLGTLDLGQWEGVPLYAQNDCAERLWSVNASIIGGKNSVENSNSGRNALYQGSEQTFMRLDLLKVNSFYSQWCGSPPEELGPFQSATVRPSRNLFRGVEEVTNSLDKEETLYSRARIEAYFNVPRGDFEADEYANGDTSELACRGLYGSYALFIPAGVLSLRQSDGSYTNGLYLDEVDDILLRLDYLSVAK